MRSLKKWSKQLVSLHSWSILKLRSLLKKWLLIRFTAFLPKVDFLNKKLYHFKAIEDFCVKSDSCTDASRFQKRIRALGLLGPVRIFSSLTSPTFSAQNICNTSYTLEQQYRRGKKLNFTVEGFFLAQQKCAIFNIYHELVSCQYGTSVVGLKRH